MDKTTIFLSWSGVRSKRLASILHKWLPRLIHYVEPWMSDKDIQKGERWFHSISEALSENSIGIICVTPENLFAPWLLFEAGAISKTIGESKVCPVIYGMGKRELKGPLNLFQSTSLKKNDFLKLILSINNEQVGIAKEVIVDTLDRFWVDIENDVRLISNEVEGSKANISMIANAFSKFSYSEPEYGRHVHFSSGFESHHLYSLCYELAEKRLFIWGRKNRKVFDKEHSNFFESLREKIDKGFDFRVLFLSPNSPLEVLKTSHKDMDFPQQLSNCIENSKALFNKNSIDFKNLAREYRCVRSSCLILVDDTLIYTPVVRDIDGVALGLTKSPFSLMEAKSQAGKQLLAEFEVQWDNAAPL